MQQIGKILNIHSVNSTLPMITTNDRRGNSWLADEYTPPAAKTSSTTAVLVRVSSLQLVNILPRLIDKIQV